MELIPRIKNARPRLQPLTASPLLLLFASIRAPPPAQVLVRKTSLAVKHTVWTLCDHPLGK